MLEWKPASRPGAILAMQDAISRQPELFDPNELYYFVTLEELSDEIGPPRYALGYEEKNTYLEQLGLRPDVEVFQLRIKDRRMDTSGLFVPRSALIRANIEVPPWVPDDAPRRTPVRISREGGGISR